MQRGAPDQLRGRIFTVLMSSNYAVFLAGMVAAGPLTNAYGARWVWGGAAAVAAVAALAGFLLARSIGETHATPVEPAPVTQTERV